MIIWYLATAVITGALLMTFQVQGINDIECELLMKAMLFSGERMNWPPDWDESLVSLQSTGQWMVSCAKRMWSVVFGVLNAGFIWNFIDIFFVYCIINNIFTSYPLYNLVI